MPRGPRKLTIKFGTATLTHYGGVYLLHRFLSRLGFKDGVARQLRVAQRNNRYSIGQMLLALLYPMILGLERIETTRLLRQNGVFQYLTGLRVYPNASTLRRFLLRVALTALPQLRALHDRFLARMTVRPHPPSRLIFDVDATVLVLYGKQQEAKIGYNPLKRGRPSYHPLLCFEGRSKTSGRASCGLAMPIPPAGRSICFRHALPRCPWGPVGDCPRRQRILRLYAGRVARRTTGPVRDCGPSDGPDQTQAVHLRYVSPSRGIEVAEFRYQPIWWPQPSRFVVIRR